MSTEENANKNKIGLQELFNHFGNVSETNNTIDIPAIVFID